MVLTTRYSILYKFPFQRRNSVKLNTSLTLIGVPEEERISCIKKPKRDQEKDRTFVPRH